MAGQEHARPQRRDEEPPEAPDTPPPTPSGAAVKENLDDDIDSVLDMETLLWLDIHIARPDLKAIRLEQLSMEDRLREIQSTELAHKLGGLDDPEALDAKPSRRHQGQAPASFAGRLLSNTNGDEEVVRRAPPQRAPSPPLHRIDRQPDRLRDRLPGRSGRPPLADHLRRPRT